MSGLRYGLWSLFVPSQAVGANLVFWDLWNGGERPITVSSLMAIKDGVTAVSGVISVQLFLTRTTAVGTGGTEDTNDGTSLTACTISKLQQKALPADISARLTPTGGATAGAVICERHLFSEETNATNYEGLEFLPSLLVVPEGTGIRIVQGATASVGKIGFQGTFY
jgi:hypothetical protein